MNGFNVGKRPSRAVGVAVGTSLALSSAACGIISTSYKGEPVPGDMAVVMGPVLNGIRNAANSKLCPSEVDAGGDLFITTPSGLVVELSDEGGFLNNPEQLGEEAGDIRISLEDPSKPIPQKVDTSIDSEPRGPETEPLVVASFEQFGSSSMAGSPDGYTSYSLGELESRFGVDPLGSAQVKFLNALEGC